MSFRLSYANVVATLCLVGLAGVCAITAGAQSGAPKQLAACYKKSGAGKGTMRFLPKASSRCKRTEKKVTWNQTGPQGPQGVQGPAGQQGLPGTSGSGGVAPSGAVMFFDLGSCPAGWTAYENARGRYIVGMTNGGTLGVTVGTALSDQQNRAVGTHSHGVTDPGHGHAINGSGSSLQVPNAILSFNGRGPISSVAAAPNSFTTGIMPSTTGISIQAAGGTGGTTAPYVQLLPCQKD
jgi:hypothetical protein